MILLEAILKFLSGFLDLSA